MPLAPEMKKLIDEKLANLDHEHQTRLTIKQVMDRFSRMVAQVDVDKDALITTNFDWTKQSYYNALSIYLYETHAERTAAEGKGPGAQLREHMPKFNTIHKKLSLVCNFAIEKTGNQNLQTAYNKIKEKGNNLDTLQDILALAVVLRDFIDIVAAFTPGGTLVNDEYLDTVTKEVEDLLQENGETNNSGTERGKLVDKQRRLITLCLDAIDEIRIYAEGTFYDNMDYFKQHYQIYDFHKNRESHTEEDEVQPIPDSPTPPETETGEE